MKFQQEKKNWTMSVNACLHACLRACMAVLSGMPNFYGWTDFKAVLPPSYCYGEVVISRKWKNSDTPFIVFRGRQKFPLYSNGKQRFVCFQHQLSQDCLLYMVHVTFKGRKGKENVMIAYRHSFSYWIKLLSDKGQGMLPDLLHTSLRDTAVRWGPFVSYRPA